MEESLERGERDTSLPLWDRSQLEQCFKCRTDISTIYCLFLFLFYMWPVRSSGLATLKLIQNQFADAISDSENLGGSLVLGSGGLCPGSGSFLIFL